MIVMCLVIRDANARVMAVKGRNMWCVIWCDRGWRIHRIRMPVLLQIVIGERGLGWDDRRGGDR